MTFNASSKNWELKPDLDFAVIGGGAAGIFAALTYAECAPSSRIAVFERSSKLLAKVKVSGGGRCNVTHACFDPATLVKHYPRGSRELRGAFHRWQPKDMIEWFAQRRIALKTEPDGRMFPTSDDSQTIIDCFLDEAQRSGIALHTRCEVTRLEKTDSGFILHFKNGTAFQARNVLIATGGGGTGGHALAESLGHTLVPLVPSLFTFKIQDSRLTELAGISVSDAQVSVSEKQRQRGPLLITHWGLSGPAILRLSAWEARALEACQYTFELSVNWAGDLRPEACMTALAETRNQSPRKTPARTPLFGIPSRLWERLVQYAGVPAETPWAQVKKEHLQALCGQITAATFAVTGKSTHKDEFVTCGGVQLSEVDFKTFGSRLCPGLYFAGEVLDIDGITGGFNFQAAWTGAHLAGSAAAGRNASQIP